jgi:hypothetical protein
MEKRKYGYQEGEGINFSRKAEKHPYDEMDADEAADFWQQQLKANEQKEQAFKEQQPND